MARMILDHFCLGTPNMFWTAKRLRDRTGLGAYDGGWFPRTGVGMRVVPLPELDQYIEIESVIEFDRAKKSPFAMWFHDATREEALVGWTIRVETMAELEELSKRYQAPIGHFVGLRVMPDDSLISVYGVVDTPVVWPKGLPNFICWDRKDVIHPAGRPANHTSKPGKIAWVEFGDEDHRLRDWLGDDLKQLPEIRIVQKGIGLKAAGVEIGGKVVEIRPPFGPDEYAETKMAG